MNGKKLIQYSILILLVHVYILSYANPMDAPEFTWSIRAGGNGHDYGEDIACDSDGNVIVGGIFINSIIFDTDTLIGNSQGKGFVVKLNPYGKVIWSKTLQGNSLTSVYRIAVVKSGNILITGSFSGSIQLGDFKLNATISTYQTYIALLDSSGDVIWANDVGKVSVTDIVADTNGDFGITGYFDSSINFDGIELKSEGRSDVFIAKYNSSGNALWAKSAGSQFYENGQGLAIDASGNIFITGSFDRKIYFENKRFMNYCGSDIFLAKYSPTGNLLWCQKAGSWCENNSSGWDYVEGIITDNEGNCVISGFFSGPAIFGSDTVFTAPGRNIYTVKFNPEGKVKWIHGGIGNPSLGMAMATNDEGDIIIGGHFEESLTFDTITVTENGDDDFYIVSYNKEGQVQWVQTAIQLTGIDNLDGIAFNKFNNIFLTGYFNGSLKFGNTTLTSAGCPDVFVARLGTPPSLTVTSPNGGETLDGPWEITWTSNQTSGQVNIYCICDETRMLVAENVTDTGSFNWDVPDMIYCETAKIGIVDTEYLFCADESDSVFTIDFGVRPCRPPYIKVCDIDSIGSDTITVEIKIEGNLNPIYAAGLSISYCSNAFSLVEVQRGELMAAFPFFSGKEKEPGLVVIGGFDTNPIPADTTGVLVKMLLQVNQFEPGDSCELAIVELFDDLQGMNSYPGLITLAIPDTSELSYNKETPDARASNNEKPNHFALNHNYPNPFNMETEISYQLAADSEIRLAIYNALGQKVRTLAEQFQSVGSYSIRWNGRNDAGLDLTSGIYFYRLEAGQFSAIRKMILLK